MDPIQLAWMVNQMESYKPDDAARRKVVSGAARLPLHLVFGRRKAFGVRQLRRKVALSN